MEKKGGDEVRLLVVDVVGRGEVSIDHWEGRMVDGWQNPQLRPRCITLGAPGAEFAVFVSSHR